MREDVMRELSQRQKYLNSLSGVPQQIQPYLQKARHSSDQFLKTAISLDSAEALFVANFLKLHQAKTMVEIGTLTGASALWWAWVLGEKGKLWTFELNPLHAAAAREVLSKYQDQHGGLITVVEGDARAQLEAWSKSSEACILDAVFIDGNKAAYRDYFEWALRNTKSGSVIILDNVFLWGGVYDDAESGASEKQIQIMKDLNHQVMTSGQFTSFFVPTDEGLIIAVRN